MTSFLPPFSLIYCEESERHHPVTQEILAHFPLAHVIEIPSYQEFFFRTKQDFLLQKKAPQLIIARKYGTLLYSYSPLCQTFDFAESYFITPLLGCLYNCHYCFLQGMLPSAHLVAFTNIDAMIDAIRLQEQQKPHTPLHVAASFETDLLACAGFLPHTRLILELSQTLKNTVIEIRTKSAPYFFLKNREPVSNIVLAWTLSPSCVQKPYETKTPSLFARLKCLRLALKKGWRIRLCFDPLLPLPHWKETYHELIAQTAAFLGKQNIERIEDISVGVLRFSPDVYKKITKLHPLSPILNAAFFERHNTSSSPYISYPDKIKTTMLTEICTLIRTYFNKEPHEI